MTAHSGAYSGMSVHNIAQVASVCVCVCVCVCMHVCSHVCMCLCECVIRCDYVCNIGSGSYNTIIMSVYIIVCVMIDPCVCKGEVCKGMLCTLVLAYVQSS